MQAFFVLSNPSSYVTNPNYIQNASSVSKLTNVILRSEHFSQRAFFASENWVWYYWLQALKPSAPQPPAPSDHDELEKDRH
jgi:hypothetical protein